MSLLRNLAVTWGFRKLSPLEQAASEYEDAQRDLLTAHSHLELSAGRVKVLEARVKRLRDTIPSLRVSESALHSESQ